MLSASIRSFSTVSGKPKVAVIGAGWGGFGFAKNINKKMYDVTLISPRNHFLMTPLLPSAAVGTIEFRAIQEPVRTIKGLKYFQAECKDIDLDKKVLTCEEYFTKNIYTEEYDYLMLAPGMRSRTFKTPGLSEENHVFFLKNLWDARRIRNRANECFERASNPKIDPGERKRLLTFIIVGGGPTSVEFAGELHDLCAKDLKRWYPELVDEVSIKIVEPAPELLGNFSAELKKYVMSRYRKYNMDIMTGTACSGIERFDGHKTRAIFSNGQI